MAEAKVVVSYGIGGVSEYLNEGEAHGVVVLNATLGALVDAVADVAKDPVGRRRAGRAAAAFVRGQDGGKDLSFDRMARQYANLYAGLACGGEDPLVVACEDGAAAAASGRDPARMLQDGDDEWALACGVREGRAVRRGAFERRAFFARSGGAGAVETLASA